MLIPFFLAIFLGGQYKESDSDHDFNALIKTQEKQIGSIWSLDLKYEVRYEVAGQDDYDVQYLAISDKRKMDVFFKSGLKISDVISGNVHKSVSIPSASSKEKGGYCKGYYYFIEWEAGSIFVVYAKGY
jgi:hypothetical protein